ncbi:MAG: hypothetical protein ACRDGA_11975 [Bacteroidota bacterium]
MILVLIILYSFSEAQIRTLGVFDFPSDARFISMGTAGMGVPGSYPHYVSPAQLAENDYGELSYGVRPINWVKDLDARFSYLSISVPITASQTLGIFYDRYYQGTGLLTSSESPGGIGIVEPVEHLFGVSYARKIGEALSVGASLKQFRFTANPDAEATRAGYKQQTGNATIVDLGLSYFVPILNSEPVSSKLYFSTALMNFGTWINFSNDDVQQMPRYLRFGAAHDSRFSGTEFWQQYSILLSIQYQNILNEKDPGLRDYWSFGGELGWCDLIFLRTGITVLPYTSYFGNRNQGAATYGLGFSLPLKRIASSLERFHLKFDYAAVPLNLDLYPQFRFFLEDVRYNNVYSIRIVYVVKDL